MQSMSANNNGLSTAVVTVVKDSAQSAPTSPIYKSTVQQDRDNNNNNNNKTATNGRHMSSAAKFFTFRWLFRGSKNSSSASKRRRLKQINDKTKEKLQTIGQNTAKRLLKQSYSFDDIQQFLINAQQNNKSTGANNNGCSVGGGASNAALDVDTTTTTADNRLADDCCSSSSAANNRKHWQTICKSSLEIPDRRKDDQIFVGHNNKSSLKSSKYWTRIKCKLCLTDRFSYEMHSIWSCGCAFCKTCLTQYCETSIRDGKVSFVGCPDGLCPQLTAKNNQISSREIKLLVTPDMYDSYKRYRLNWLIERDPTRTWCPTPNCETVCYIRQASKHKDSSKKPIPFYCTTCNKTFCSACRRNWHLGVDCKKFSAQEEVLLDESSPIKRCPFCCILIERDEGCAQIMCRNCKHVFCWFCLASLEDDFLLRHYDKGKCKDKLGHSRASVIWHRTQVVGIFAGFGLLILLASPMFILAAPCLLCCRCNALYKYGDDQTDVVTTDDDGGGEFDPINNNSSNSGGGGDSDIGNKSGTIL
ncbi:uncharacterized protein LOC128956194 [Oppia nitens]|uniref:uncharacterized protein LOC128956194 n=1 Tax=Oppia nitens TaxID=1686743 RepID=UPI0023D9B979|nr:uncharacterized protein LOC128956194 [Oppia nitens]